MLFGFIPTNLLEAALMSYYPISPRDDITEAPWLGMVRLMQPAVPMHAAPSPAHAPRPCVLTKPAQAAIEDKPLATTQARLRARVVVAPGFRAAACSCVPRPSCLLWGAVCRVVEAQDVFASACRGLCVFSECVSASGGGRVRLCGAAAPAV